MTYLTPRLTGKAACSVSGFGAPSGKALFQMITAPR
jgi:hypothetical protein